MIELTVLRIVIHCYKESSFNPIQVQFLNDQTVREHRGNIVQVFVFPLDHIVSSHECALRSKTDRTGLRCACSVLFAVPAS